MYGPISMFHKQMFNDLWDITTFKLCDINICHIFCFVYSIPFARHDSNEVAFLVTGITQIKWHLRFFSFGKLHNLM